MAPVGLLASGLELLALLGVLLDLAEELVPLGDQLDDAGFNLVFHCYLLLS